MKILQLLCCGIAYFAFCFGDLNFNPSMLGKIDWCLWTGITDWYMYIGGCVEGGCHAINKFACHVEIQTSTACNH